MHKWKIIKIRVSVRIRIKTKLKTHWSLKWTEPRKLNNLREYDSKILIRADGP